MHVHQIPLRYISNFLLDLIFTNFSKPLPNFFKISQTEFPVFIKLEVINKYTQTF